MSDAYRVAPGRAIKGDDGYEYAEGAEIKCLCPRDVETFLTDGTIVRVDGPPPPAQPSAC